MGGGCQNNVMQKKGIWVTPDCSLAPSPPLCPLCRASGHPSSSQSFELKLKMDFMEVTIQRNERNSQRCNTHIKVLQLKEMSYPNYSPKWGAVNTRAYWSRIVRLPSCPRPRINCPLKIQQAVLEKWSFLDLLHGWLFSSETLGILTTRLCCWAPQVVYL